MTDVDGCRYCGAKFRSSPEQPHPHGQRWVESVGWHVWTTPTQEQILERMRARRSEKEGKETT